jgi:3-methyladenine DNA glycosylase AlkD
MPGRSASLAALRRDMKAAADPVRGIGTASFFKTRPGEYGEGDKFLGITVPDLRRIARAHRELPSADRLTLLRSPWHEERAVALMLLVDAHERASQRDQAVLHREYLANTAFVNNWDLVDASAAEMVGTHVAAKGTALIEKLARSKSLWERRIAIVATFAPIRANDFAPTVLIAERLLADPQDLIHKAVGWLLREVGKRDISVLRGFLELHAATMPRTALRYAIERMDVPERHAYMARKKATSPTP